MNPFPDSTLIDYSDWQKLSVHHERPELWEEEQDDAVCIWMEDGKGLHSLRFSPSIARELGEALIAHADHLMEDDDD